MSKEITHEVDAIYGHIDESADEYARNQSGYILDGDELGAENNPKKHSYDRIKRHYKAGASPLGERLAEAEQKAARYEKALKAIRDWQLPATGKFWNDAELTPMSYEACYGSNGVRDYMRALANEALTPKQTISGD